MKMSKVIMKTFKVIKEFIVSCIPLFLMGLILVAIIFAMQTADVNLKEKEKSKPKPVVFNNDYGQGVATVKNKTLLEWMKENKDKKVIAIDRQGADIDIVYEKKGKK